jgi:O-antigen ligase
LFDDPNVFGPFLMPITLIMLEDLLVPRLFKLSWIVKSLMLCVLSGGILVSASRGAWLSIVVALVVLMVVLAARRRGGSRVIPFLAALLAMAIIVGALVSMTSSKSDLGGRVGAQSYDVSRFSAQHQGMELAWRHPLGIGPGQFENEASYGGQGIAAHSLFIRAFAEEGILGLGALVMLVLATLLYALRAAVKGVSLYGIGSAALLAAWSGILVHSFFVDSLQWRHAWLVAALIWTSAMLDERRPRDTADLRRAPPARVIAGT